MKYIVTILLVCFVLCMFVGCSYETDDKSMLEDLGFIHLKTYGRRTYLVYDTETRVQYIVNMNYGRSFCPYYDETGNVAIYGE